MKENRIRHLFFQYKKYFLLLILFFAFIFLLSSSLTLIRRKVIDYFNSNQLLLAQQASIGLKDLFQRNFESLKFLATLDEIIQMNAKGAGLLEQYFKNSGQHLMGLTRVNSDGVITFTLPVSHVIGRNISYQQHMNIILREKEPILSDVFMAVQNFRAVAYHVPVFKSTGEFDGTLALLINFEHVARKFIDNIDTGSGCNAWIISQNGTILHAKNRRLLGSDSETVSGNDTFSRLTKRILSATEGIDSYTLRSQNAIQGKETVYWVAYCPVHLENTFWAVAVSTPETVILQTLELIERKWLFLFLLLGVGALIFIYSVMKTRTRESLVRERNFTNKALDSQLDTFFVFDLRRQKAARWNQRFKDLCGYSDEEIARLTEPFPYHGQEDGEKVSTAIEETLKFGFCRKEISLISRDKIRIALEYHSSIIRGEGDEPEYLISVGREISERKKAEKALLESHRLAVIGEMAAAVAHDFNNSLQVILGNLELTLKDLELSSPARERLMMMEKATRDAAVRVQMLQRFGGKKGKTASYSAIGINVLIDDVIQQTRPIWKDSVEKQGYSIAIITSYGDIPEVMGNGSELKAVIYNVLKNSVEAMPQGGRIVIGTSSHGQSVRVVIQDNGLGMDEETRQRVFQPFFSTKGFELGRGLGMSGAYGIISEHGGSIVVEQSRPGNGTQVVITLPAGSVRKVFPPGEIRTSPEFNKPRILWVDDEPMIRELGQEMLASLDCSGDFASTGQEALAQLEQKAYRLVITDVGMPKMNGLELAKAIKEQYDPEIRVAVLTGWGETLEEYAPYSRFIDFFLSKPVTLEQIQDVIRKSAV